MSEKYIEIEMKPKAGRRVKPAHVTKYSTPLPTPEEIMISVGFSTNNILQLIQQIRRGVAVSSLYALADRLSIGVNEMSEIVNISARTFTRRKREGVLHADETERVYRLADLMARATEVLHSNEDAQHWLKTPKKALGGETPLKLADTELGAKEVKDLLGRIEHGVFS